METALRKIISYIKDNNNISVFPVKLIFNYKYGKESIIKKIIDIDKCREQEIKTYYEKSEYENYLSKINFDDTIVIKTEVPKVSLYYFENALVNIDSSSIVFKNKILVTRTEGERFNEGFL